MKNNILGFIVYLLASVVFSPSVGIILLAMKENSDGCHYYGGEWNNTDIIIGCSAVALGATVRYLLFNYFNIV